MIKKDLVEKLGSLGDADEVVFRTKAEDEQFMNNYKVQVIEKEIPSRIAEVHQQYDEDLFALTGKRKQSTQKTYNFLKEVVGEFKTKAERAAELEVQITTLQEQIKSGAHDAGLKKELEDVKKEYKNLQTKHTTEIAEKETAFKKFRIGADIDRELSKFKLIDMDESVRNVYLEKIKSDLVNNAEFDGEKLVFKGEDGTILKNIQTMNPKTINELLAERLIPIIDPGRRLPGAGGERLNAAAGASQYIPSAGLKVDDLSEDILKQTGWKRGSKEFDAAFKEWFPKLAAIKS